MSGKDAFEKFVFFQGELRSEQRFFWGRFTALTGTQVTLMGVFLVYFNRPFSWPQCFTLIFIISAALVIVSLVRSLNEQTSSWIDKYLAKLREIEEEAIGDFRMNRAVVSKELQPFDSTSTNSTENKFRSTRKFAENFYPKFYAAWILLGAVYFIPHIGFYLRDTVY